MTIYQYEVCKGKIRVKDNTKGFGLSTGRIGFHFFRKGKLRTEWVWRDKQEYILDILGLMQWVWDFLRKEV